MFYIIPNYYEPNTAATNRFLALLKGLSLKLDAKKSCEVEFFLPNKKRDKLEVSYSNVSVNYWWNKPLYFKNRYLKYFSFFLAVKTFIRRLKTGDSVLLLGHVELLPIIQKKWGVRVYLEMNEFPEIFEIGNGLIKISNDQLLECCRKLDGLFVISNSLKEYFSEKGIFTRNYHGDFHLENILYNDDSFILLDWRQNFGKSEVGDVYYDLAKMWHSLIVNHSLVKEDLFFVDQLTSKKFRIDIHRTFIDTECEKTLISFIEKKYNIDQTELLTAIVFLNICACHTYPYSRFLFYLGKYLLNCFYIKNPKYFIS